MMTQYGTLEQGRWNAKETFEYRFELNEKEGLFACLARVRGGIYIAGFAIDDTSQVLNDGDPDWIAPSKLLGMMNNAAFEKRY